MKIKITFYKKFENVKKNNKLLEFFTLDIVKLQTQKPSKRWGFLLMVKRV